MKLLIVDTETTSLDERHGTTIEIGCILYSVPHRTSLVQFSTLLRADENPAQAVNKIPVEATREVNNELAMLGIEYVRNLMRQADYLIAHNAEFDRKFLAQRIDESLISKWICSCSDIDWPGFSGKPRLIDIALAYGLPIVNPHRALTDCRLLAEIFSREPALEQLIADALEPKDTYIANVSFNEKEKAKAHGFSWEPVTKKWIKKMNEKKALEIPFSIIKVKSAQPIEDIKE
jgi:DNA polymerase-3 subunit epsilon